MFLRASLRCLHISAVASARARGSGAPQAMGKHVYAVVTGRRPGLYTSWEQCLLQVKGFPGNRYKGFANEQEAVRYLQENGVAAAGTGKAAGGGEAAAAAAAPSDASAAAPQRKRRVSSSSAAVKRQQPAKEPSLGAAVAAGAGGGSTAAAPLPGPTDRVLRLEFDGASKNNPGPAGFGAVLYDDATNVEVARLCQYMGPYHTNNQAEYAGLIAGLQAALELGCSRIKVLGDSTLIIRQLMGEWRVKNEGLQPYHAAAVALRQRFAGFEARQVRREFNKVADALSNQAIDDYRSGVNPHLWRLETAVAAAAGAQARGAGASGSGAAAAAVASAGTEGAGAPHAGGAAAGDAAVEVAAAALEGGQEGGAGGDSPSSSEGAEPKKRTRLD